MADLHVKSLEKDTLQNIWRNAFLDFIHVSLPSSKILEYKELTGQLMKRHKLWVVDRGVWNRPENFSMAFSKYVEENVEKSLSELLAAFDEIVLLAHRLEGSMEYCHGVGVKMDKYMESELGPTGLKALRKIKNVLDPDNIMNPGKLGLREDINDPYRTYGVMGRTGKEIVKADINEVLSDLSKAYADEWLAHYQYWVAAMWLKGVDADTFKPILLEMSQHELKHAEKLARRIIELGGKPLLDFSKLLNTSGCGYIPPPEDPTDYIKLAKDILKAEECAIRFYNKMVDKYRTTDVVTHEVFEELLEDEVEDEQTWEDFLAKL